MCQPYKTFYDCNLRVFVPGRPYEPSLLFLGRVRSLPIVEHLKGARDKYSTFLQTLKNTDVKSFVTFCCGSIPVKHFTTVVYICIRISSVKIYIRLDQCVNVIKNLQS